MPSRFDLITSRLLPAALTVLAATSFGLSCLPADAASRSLGDLTGPWQLLVDDALIAEKRDVVRVYHPFEKDSRNPVLVPDRPWEGQIVYLYGTVLPNERGAGYRMWISPNGRQTECRKRSASVSNQARHPGQRSVHGGRALYDGIGDGDRQSW